MKIKHITLILILLLVVTYALRDRDLPVRRYDAPREAPVIRVHDGDTISVIIDAKQEKIRLIGIDAPELAQGHWGKEAKKYLETLVDASGRRVRLEFDATRRDKYGRILAYVWAENGEMINLLMVKSGHAVLYTIPPNVRYTNELRQAQEEARDMALGIWGKKGLEEMPSDYRKRHPRT